MDQGGKQQFPYSYKTISIPVNSQLGFAYPYLELLNPENIFEVELLYTHVRILFDAAISSDLKKVLRVTVGKIEPDPTYGFETVTESRSVEVNKSAVSNIVDLNLDLSPLVFKGYQNRITLELPSTDQYGSISGTNIVQIWKADMAYTVKGLI